MLISLLLLITLPVAAYIWSRKHRPKSRYFITLLTLGLIVTPLSLGLYATYFLGPAGIVTGMIGLASVMFHGAPGYQISLHLGLIPLGEVATGSSHIIVSIINGILWGLVYGAIGYGIDRLRNRTNVL